MSTPGMTGIEEMSRRTVKALRLQLEHERSIGASDRELAAIELSIEYYQAQVDRYAAERGEVTT